MAKQVLEVDTEALSERYLGLPTVVGRSKEGCFQYITERSGLKVSGWKGQGLSKKGKEILVKSVLQATPAYPMSCFKFNKTQCKKLGSISSNFWWGDADGSRKVHWISWDKMCQPKHSGGMGFRNFEAFNLALLAKQAWRILTVPSSLCARVLKARYFKHSDLLHAGCPGQGSFTWRSILHGRDLLKRGLIWRIGDGSKVDVWQSNWIPRAGSPRPLGRRPNSPGNMVRKVSDLMDLEGTGWDEARLNQVFFEFDVADIKNIIIGGPMKQDVPAWNFTNNGQFSVKSAYHLQMQIMREKQGRIESSSTVEAHRGWLKLWGANIPGKVKVHVWRLMRNGLALGAELQRRRIKGGVFCVACGREETALHRFWQCNHAKQIWHHARLLSGALDASPPNDVHNSRNLMNWMLEWLAAVKDSEMDITLMILYHSWLARNDARDGKKIEEPESIVKRATCLLEEWHNVQVQKPIKVAVTKERWSSPETGWIKVNTDGTWHKASEKGGGGVVVRDHDGRFLAGACHFFPSLPDPEAAELLACKRAMQLVKHLKLKEVVLELDCVNVVRKLNEPEMDRSVQSFVIEELKRELKELDGHVVRWVRRTANSVAHRLAKESCDLELCKT
jgi:ribonuclease HI